MPGRRRGALVWAVALGSAAALDACAPAAPPAVFAPAAAPPSIRAAAVAGTWRDGPCHSEYPPNPSADTPVRQKPPLAAAPGTSVPLVVFVNTDVPITIVAPLRPTVTITNEAASATVVWAGTLPAWTGRAGPTAMCPEFTFLWNQKGADGRPVPEGAFRIAVDQPVVEYTASQSQVPDLRVGVTLPSVWAESGPAPLDEVVLDIGGGTP